MKRIIPALVVSLASQKYGALVAQEEYARESKK
jgi:hypothetical protein